MSIATLTNFKPVLTYLTPAQHKAIKKRAAARGVSSAEVIREAIAKHLKETRK